MAGLELAIFTFSSTSNANLEEKSLQTFLFTHWLVHQNLVYKFQLTPLNQPSFLRPSSTVPRKLRLISKVYKVPGIKVKRDLENKINEYLPVLGLTQMEFWVRGFEMKKKGQVTISRGDYETCNQGVYLFGWRRGWIPFANLGKRFISRFRGMRIPR